MNDSEGWLQQFGESHQGLAHPLAFWLGVPALIAGYVGLLWCLPIPAQFFDISPLLNWGSAFLMAAAVYYFIISMPIAMGLLPLLLAVAALHLWAAHSLTSQLELSLTLGCSRCRRIVGWPSSVAGRSAARHPACHDRAGLAAVAHLPSIGYPAVRQARDQSDRIRARPD
ncbi:MAG: hypothetical protein AAGA33_04135 [Pseudomonadota bacterium]